MIKLQNITKKYKDKTVLNNISLEIKEKEFLVLLGPSGSGKTTLLRLIAGFESPNSGNILINNKIVNNIPPNKRNIGMVFQDLALWPHMSVYQNIAFGIKTKDKETRIKEMLNVVHLNKHLDYYPDQLSGGEKQRVALARALVQRPKVLLLDEPLSNLDHILKDKIQELIIEIHNKFDITTIYVTHDNIDTKKYDSRIAVINNGEIIQTGKYSEILNSPKNSFIKEFIK